MDKSRMNSMLRNTAVATLAVAVLGLSACASTQDEGMESPEPASMAPAEAPATDPNPPTEAPPPPSEGTPGADR